jgi:hypothetical protein
VEARVYGIFKSRAAVLKQKVTPTKPQSAGCGYRISQVSRLLKKSVTGHERVNLAGISKS